MPLTDLTPRQLEAVLYSGGPIMVLAGPGTGKTRTLTFRLAHIIRERAVPAGNILAVTFTNQAAEEMAERVRGLRVDRQDSARPRITTFHGFAYRLLHQWLPEPPVLLSENESFQLLQETVRDVRPDFPRPQLKELSRRISLAKGSLQSPEERNRLPAWPLFPDWAFLYQNYQQRLAYCGFWDFDELIAHAIRLLENRPDFREEIQAKFPYVLVDEFQDINAAQYRLFQLLTRPGGEWMVIGDPNQAIYGFRGARTAFFSRIRKDSSQLKEICLDETFRLNRTILSAAGQVLAASPDSLSLPLTTRKTGPAALPVASLASAEAEARYLARIIEQEMGGLSLLAAGSETEKSLRSFSDFAVLYRLHAQGEEIGRVFQETGLPYQRVREAHWADCPEIRGLLMRLRALLPFRVTPLQALEGIRQETPSGPGPGDETLRTPDPEALKKLRFAAAAHAGNLETFIETLALQTGLDTYQPDRETVKLMTLHAAKGLEFPIVFIVGCETNLLPLTLFDDTDPEEERRLFYVGCTRAIEKLYFTWARRRFLLGRALTPSLSPFVEDIAVSLRSSGPAAGGGKAGPRRNRQMSLFR